MVTLGKNEPCKVLTLVFVSLAGGQLFAQAPLVVQQLQPINPEARTLQPIVPPTSPNIQLETIPQTSRPAVAPTQKATGPVNVLPLAPAKSDPNKSDPKISKGKLNVDNMIRTPTDHVALFSKLNIDRSFIEQSSLASPVRGQPIDEVGSYEWSPSGYCWQSPAFCHSPLYFEQPNLERYGNGHGPLVDPVLSASYFLGQVVTSPAKAMWQPPWSKSCTLGHKRPGDCAPLQRRQQVHTAPSQGVVVKISE